PKTLRKLRGKKALLKKQKERGEGIVRKGEKNGSEVQAYLIILLVLVPYFLCVTGVMYNIFGVPRAIILNSEGEEYDRKYVHDQDSYGAKWLKESTSPKSIYYADYPGDSKLVSQAMRRSSVPLCFALESDKINGYIYLGYYNVVAGELLDRRSDKIHNLTEYQDKFVSMNKIYANGGSEVWERKQIAHRN
ncbi:MAG: DUF2206 domain-containing protein, partial [Methanophagales archaeon]|nr:DUF2206 domain-containing protein [Methanophagales archaeon]